MLKNKPKKNYRYGPSEGYELRCQRRLQEDLGIDEAAAEAILHLRNQVIELQTQLRQMETELAIQNEIQKLRISHYRQVSYEASWVEIELQE